MFPRLLLVRRRRLRFRSPPGELNYFTEAEKMEEAFFLTFSGEIVEDLCVASMLFWQEALLPQCFLRCIPCCLRDAACRSKNKKYLAFFNSRHLVREKIEKW